MPSLYRLGKTREGKYCRLFNGRKYVFKNSAFCSTTKPFTTLANDIWKKYNGPIPKGYCVIHIDGKRRHDYLSNYRLMRIGAAVSRWQTLFNIKPQPFVDEYHEMIHEIESRAHEKKTELELKFYKRRWYKEHRRVEIRRKEFERWKY